MENKFQKEKYLEFIEQNKNNKQLLLTEINQLLKFPQIHNYLIFELEKYGFGKIYSNNFYQTASSQTNKKSTTKNVTNYFVWEYQNINNSSDVEILFDILKTLIINLK